MALSMALTSTCKFKARPEASTMLDGCSVAGRVQVCPVCCFCPQLHLYPRTDPRTAPGMSTCLDQRTLLGQT